jgi:hypothetical protein
VLIRRINVGTDSKPDRGSGELGMETGACFRGKVVFGALATLVSQWHLAKAWYPAKAVTASIGSLALLSGE